jgi:hypothetical protein
MAGRRPPRPEPSIAIVILQILGRSGAAWRADPGDAWEEEKRRRKEDAAYAVALFREDSTKVVTAMLVKCWSTCQLPYRAAGP